MTTEKDRILIFDTTMRDGEQSPGASMTHNEKLELADLLETMGVDIIEAGFPASSQGDFEAVREIARRSKSSVITGLSRSKLEDIDRCGEAVRHAARPRIHTFISTSPVHMKHKLQMGPNAVLEAVGRSVAHARNLVDDVEWSAEDATRTEFDFLCKCIDAAITSGATTINVPDTVGYTHPDEYGALIRSLREAIPDSDKVIWSTHCHNDLGLAVANSIAGAQNGARQIECTINGLGERAGNAALEEIVMAFKVRGDSLPFETGIDTTRLARASQMVSRITGFPVQYNKAIVGKNAFAHESGIHQDGMLKNTETYEIMKPEDVGVSKSSLVMGKLSGRNAFRDKIKALGYELDPDSLNEAFRRFKDLADRKKHVFDDDILALVDDQLSAMGERVGFDSLRVIAGSVGPQKADLSLRVDGELLDASCTGNGPVDAVFNAIRTIVKHDAKLDLYQVHAVTGGTDAQAEVSVRLNGEGIMAVGRASDPDTLVASAKAYIHALNKLEARRMKRLAA
ncbi:MAG: 2-isopropylmalate synthase [Henriciella sp.]|jgi:2-isopropylmalate synthase|uniref:2-isopropylmalate synthase n=1 Tax=Henriciella sp. TaxID=1968823 RepID=UPI000C0C90C4|nr:2-isopropylmalate synthase [Henriciella sp.]MAN74600.1 2-isopropylmalate synthase [Henriciella sp.]MBF32712.1 2-isopropylmalate synthase [Hyphomonadaceae bacterium]PHR76956.1 MAG: 2-isopropylmalate synthase [Henriciella sp.]|tara:strand:+ start:57852 stop:59387 length:1536 start_codon:yes stop_codon:yes gene_type:complete